MVPTVSLPITVESGQAALGDMVPKFSDYLEAETMPLPSNTLSDSEMVTVATEPPYVSASAVL